MTPPAAPPRVLVLSASVGAGHLRAAEAVEAALRRRAPHAEIRNVDVLTLTPAPFRRVYGKGYLDLVNHAPDLLGVLYDRTNRTPRHRSAERLRLAVERLNTRPLVDLLRDFAPHVVCHTHFLPEEILDHRARRRGLRVPQAVVVTDFDVHRFWLARSVQRYFVARAENAVHLQALGAPLDRVQATGIPILPAFADAPDLPALRAKHEVVPALPLLLILCGGFGVGPIEELVQSVLASVDGVQVVIVTGRNEELRQRLAPRVKKAPVPVRVLGFTTEMHEWMALASLAVTKPGGLTTSEALARGLPLVVANPIPGQETRNATMLFEEGAAISGENPLTVGYRVGQLLADRPRLARMAERARALGRPQAAFEVADALLAMADGR